MSRPAASDAAPPPSRDAGPPRRGIVLTVLALLLGLIGLASAGGGAWLVALGGSPFHLLFGLGLLATAVLLWRQRRVALHVFAVIVVATVAWAAWQSGMDWWRFGPRIDIPVIFGVLLLLPWVVRRLRGRDGGRAGWLRSTGPLLGSLVLAGVMCIVSGMGDDRYDMAGRLPGPRTAVPAAYGGVDPGDWSAYGRSWRGNKWSPLAQITPANVDRLQVAWQVRTGDLKRPGDPDEFTYELTPIKVGDTLYLCTPHNIVMALDAETGRERWRFDPRITVSPRLQHLTCRGVSYHDADRGIAAPTPAVAPALQSPVAPAAATVTAGGACRKRILMATNDARLFALDATTGRPCAGFGRNGYVNLWPGMPAYQQGWYQSTSAPLVTRDLVVVAGAIYDNAAAWMPSGVIRAFDVNTGRLVWNFDPGNPDHTEPLPPGGHYSWSSPNSWSTSAVDEDLGLIYVPMGNGAVDQWGGARPPTTERFAASIIALDVATGRLRWVFQTVHHDLWDMDVPAQPALVDLTLPGRGTVPALVQSTKTGNLFVLDRRTGRPIHPVFERPVPGGPAPGDRLSPTQPFSTVSLMPGKVRERDMWGSTLLDELVCRIEFKRLRYDGPFTPPSVQGSLVFPGNFGVMDWGGLSIDPARQVIFAHPSYMAFVDRLIPRGAPGDSVANKGPHGGSDRGGSDEHGYNPNRGAPFAASLNPFLSPLGLPCQAPPWGYVSGIDLVTGKEVYRHRNGTVRDEAPVPLPFEMGVPSLGGPMMTAGGVAFLSSALDYYVRAYDVTSGRELWRARLPAGGQATPMTYRSSASGRQFVVVVAGGHGSLGTKMGDYVIAYALPKGQGTR